MKQKTTQKKIYITKVISAVFFAYFTCSTMSLTLAQDNNMLFESTTKSYIQKTTTHNPTGGLHTVLKNDQKDTRALVQTFCTTVLDTEIGKHYFFQQPSIAEIAYFDATQSAFVYVLCRPGGFENRFPLFEEGGFLVKKDRKDYGIECNPESNLDGCGLDKSIHYIIIELLNDMSNIKIASAYGTNQFTADIKLNDLANQYGRYYFGDNIILCDPQHKDDNTCIYPKTLKHLKGYLRRADTIAKKNSTFDLEKLSPPTTGSCLKDLSYDYYENYINYSCGLLGKARDKGERIEPASLHDFTNVVYNEIRWYKLFITYYASLLRENLQLQPYGLTSTPENIIGKAQNDAEMMVLRSRFVEQSAEQMIAQISHIQFKFPIHIGLMMYYERLRDLRQELVKIYTPLHQLYYKLRNVQQAK